jgi:hypothetical protein
MTGSLPVFNRLSLLRPPEYVNSEMRERKKRAREKEGEGYVDRKKRDKERKR